MQRFLWIVAVVAASVISVSTANAGPAPINFQLTLSGQTDGGGGGGGFGSAVWGVGAMAVPHFGYSQWRWDATHSATPSLVDENGNYAGGAMYWDDTSTVSLKLTNDRGTVTLSGWTHCHYPFGESRPADCSTIVWTVSNATGKYVGYTGSGTFPALSAGGWSTTFTGTIRH
jgi:hypothetical protein